ncbi:MAG: hypothetical protein IJ097_02800 [Bacilli bacterium]|nr:hypothetical protein [Bacilli bacterium]
MLILPIVNRNRVMNVELRLRNAHKIKCNFWSEDVHESDIIVNREKFSNSTYRDSKEENAPTDFIRSKSILYPRDFLVTTKQKVDSKNYDVYRVNQPPRKVHASLDKLYGKAITDLRKEIPGQKNRGRYISFEKLGMDEYLTDDKIARLQRIVKEEQDQSRWPELFEKEGIADIGYTIDFITNFECTVVSNTTIPENSLQDTLKSLEIINTRDYRNLNNYYKMAKKNADIYTKLSYINKIMYDRPLSLIQSEKQKQLVKKQNEVYKPVHLTGLIGEIDDKEVA